MSLADKVEGSHNPLWLAAFSSSSVAAMVCLPFLAIDGDREEGKGEGKVVLKSLLSVSGSLGIVGAESKREGVKWIRSIVYLL